jgi:outer membrane autotransporter protein
MPKWGRDVPAARKQRRFAGVAALLASTALVVTAPARAAETTWTSLDVDWNSPASWSGGVPGASDTADFADGGSDPFFPTPVVIFDPSAVGSLHYLNSALYYDFEVLSDLAIGGGIASDSSLEQALNINGGSLSLSGGTIAGIVTINANSTGGTDIVTFSGSAGAGSATINDIASAQVLFKDQSTGGTAHINIASDLASLEFQDDASADHAAITIDGLGANADFSGAASAGSSDIKVTSGSLTFGGDAGAGSATIATDPDSMAARTVVFNDDSSAENATITSNGAFGGVDFHDSSSAGNATLIANSGGVITFYDGATGGTARLVANSGGTFRISAGSFTAGGLSVGSIEGAGTISLGGKGLTVGANDLSTEFSGKVTGSGSSLTKTGAGKLILSGTGNSYTGLTTVSGGILSVNGSILSSSGVVVDGGTLGGTGDVPSVTVATGGSVAPGNSIGTLQVTGDVTFDAGSAYDVEVDPTNSDKIVASGNATISGGTVNVLAQAGVYADHTEYTILSAGSVSGAFDDVTSNLAFLVPTLSYDGHTVILALDRSSGSFVDVARTINERAAAAGVQSLGSGNAVYDHVLGLTSAEANAAFDALSGEIHASLQGVLVEDGEPVRRAMRDRLTTISDDPGHATGLWSTGYGRTGTIGGDGNAASISNAEGGLIAGADGVIGGWRLGLLVHGGAGAIAVPDRGSSASELAYGAGVYGGTQAGHSHLSFGAALTHHDLRTEREAAFPGFDGTLGAHYGAFAAQGFVEVSQDIEAGPLTVTPFANLAHVAVARDGFAETGGVAALSGAGEMLQATFATLGVRTGQQLSLGDGGEGTLVLEAGWRHGFASLPRSTNRFASGTAFTVYGAPVGGDALALSGTLALELADNVELHLSYDGSVGTSSAQALKATLRGTF